MSHASELRAMQRAIDNNTRLGPAEPTDPLIRMLQASNQKRRATMRRRWRQRMQRLIFDITQFGRDDANCGSWDPRDMDVFLGTRQKKRWQFEARIVKLATEYIP